MFSMKRVKGGCACGRINAVCILMSFRLYWVLGRGEMMK